MRRGKGTGDFRVYFSVPELNQALDQISAYDGRTAAKIENQVEKSTKNVKAGAVQRVPVRSGDLKKTISARFDRRTISGYVKAGRYPGAQKGGVPYAHLVELGAGPVTIKSKTPLRIAPPGAEAAGLNEFSYTVNIPARGKQPFMEPAFNAEKPDLIRGLKEAVQP
jgi:HK97 gp10 family phage protein